MGMQHPNSLCWPRYILQFGKRMRSSGLEIQTLKAICISCFFMLQCTVPVAAQVIWQESFNYSNGTTVGANNNAANPAADWTSQCPSCVSGDWFEVRANRMEALDVNGPATLETEWIDISAFPQGVEVLVDLEEEGTMEGCPGGVSSGCNSVDWIRIEYRLDGGPYSDWTSPNGGSCSGSCAGATYVTYGNFPAFTFKECPLAGDSLRLRISVQCWAATEFLYLDNIIVQAQTCIFDPPTDSLVQVQCNGGADGEIWVLSENPNLPLAYSLNGEPFQGSNSFTGLGAGTYFVVEMDGTGSMDTLSGLVIAEPAGMNLSLSGLDADCNVNNGSATAVVSNGNGPYAYSWNTAPPQSSASATGLSGGTYEVTVTDSGGCTISENVTILQPLGPTVDLGNDTVVCNNREFYLDADPSGLYADATFAWSTLEETAQILVETSGVYHVTIENECGNARDSIYIEIHEQSSNLFVPNAFTPNKDGLNDEFAPVVTNVEGYHLAIFDRWGKMVFESRNPALGWDGTWNGRPVPEGIFAYTIRARDCYGELGTRGGSVTLLR